MEARKAHHTFRHGLGDFISYLNIYRAYTETRDREKFCAVYYLDKKVMDEIVNVKTSSAKSFPNSGFPSFPAAITGTTGAVARGHIQFVCVRAGKSLYHTLTAAKVQIHPSSVMWGKEPRVHGGRRDCAHHTLVRALREPSEEEWLKKVSPTLLATLRRGAAAGAFLSTRKAKGIHQSDQDRERCFQDHGRQEPEDRRHSGPKK